MPDRYYPTLAALAANPLAAPAEQLPRLRKLLDQVLREEAEAGNRIFTDLSQAIGLAAHHRRLPAALRRELQALRLAANLVLHESYPGTPAEAGAGFAALAELVERLTGVAYDGARLADPASRSPAAPVAIPTPPAAPNPADRLGATATFRATWPANAVWRVQVLEASQISQQLVVELETPAAGQPAGPFRVALPAAYLGLLPLAAALHPVLHLLGPVALSEGLIQPRRVVLEPDYLINVTTIAECAQQEGCVPEWALLKAFQADEPSRPLVLGNLVNMLLDEEVSHAARQASALVGQGGVGNEEPQPADLATAMPPDVAAEFELESFLRQKLFRAAPLHLSTLPEFQTRTGVPELLQDLRRHHRTLREARAQGFTAPSRTGYQQAPLRPEDCALEPAFLSATYGLQGRLDLLHESATGYDLIELKSSTRVPWAQPWANHAAQAQLYRLLLESVYGAEEGRGRTSILYSNAPAGQPAVRRVDQDATLIDQLLAARNQLVGTELLLARATGPAATARLLAPVLTPDVLKLPGFGREKAQRTAAAWAGADAVEQAYCLELTRFAAREMRLTLLGEEARPGDAGGQAGLWRLDPKRKQQNFTLLDELILVEDHSEANDDARQGLGPHLVFQRPAGGPEVNFRAGDTLLLYPCRRAEASAEPSAETSAIPYPPVAAAPHLTVLDAQVVKVVLAEDLGADGRVVLSVRNRRLAPRYLRGHARWALEPDTYDTFRREWAGLTAFLSLPQERRARLLARREAGPRRAAELPALLAPATSAAAVVARALAAPDWFVLCGPPGTGKTRAVLKELAVSLYKEDKQVLLAAYTNRAVDEICEQLIAAGLPFIRVGSRLGTAPVYRPYLLDNMLRDCASRQAVRERLKGCPFYVGTVASLLGKPELFTLKQFDVAVVDEASQVLEAPMVALLSKVPKFILIGDHRQLPAVVAQDAAASAVSAEVADLLERELSLKNLRNSYFERLFKRAEAHWPHAHGTLADQYRMHDELAQLVNQDFYAGQLRCPATWQTAPLSQARAHWPTPPAADEVPPDALAQAVRTRRLLWLPTRRAEVDFSMKESTQEADLAARVAAQLVAGYGADFDPETSLGIIASYRNQAALIRRRLAELAEKLACPALARVAVDTVERYQGSQREVIIMSFCCHHEHQLELLVSPDDEGRVDRKLNVALTRARQQLVLLGNEVILGRAPHHAALFERVRAAGGVVTAG
ncbi:DEAD/DEAH box helicase [uncultured Hymenobacter sp.]|uniref:DEAD/DEAH box helicase n=1 Tax=uncultured Hymenobacter sp. TaxID=170016 RepID=UPI0035CB1128